MKKISIQQVIPICFATDDNYIPFLAVAIASLLDNAATDKFYKIYLIKYKKINDKQIVKCSLWKTLIQSIIIMINIQ